MSYNIEVLDVMESQEPGKFGPTKLLTVTHKNEDGKIDAKKIFEWATPKDVWQALAQAQKGTVLSVEREKDKTGKYWNWVGVARQDAPLKVREGGQPVPHKPTYETPEERVQKQVMIVRQSSIASAINYFSMRGEKASSETVLEMATIFEDHVIGD